MSEQPETEKGNGLKKPPPPELPTLCSLACLEYFREDFRFRGFMTICMDAVDHVDILTKRILSIHAKVQKKADPYPDWEKDDLPGGYKEAFAKKLNMVFELGIPRAVDNYLTYISDLLTAIFVTRPETLRSNEMISLEEVLQYEDQKVLVHAIAEKKVHELSYKGLGDLSSHLAERLGFPLFEEPDQLRSCCTIVEIRNLIVHSRGKVNRLFLHRVRECTTKIGDRLELADPFMETLSLLNRSVIDLDQRAERHFGIRRDKPLSMERLRDEAAAMDLKP